MTLRCVFVLTACGLATALPVAAQSKDAKKFPEDVWAIMLPEEAKAYKSLKGDHAEFQKIFWARRDPDLDTPESEFEVDYRALKAQVDQKYRMPGRAGSLTDCGRVFILLGEPDDIKKDQGQQLGIRSPETWTYRDREGMKFQGGQIQVAFDAECRFPAGATGFHSQLDKIAENKVLRPSFEYAIKDGKLTKKLADLLPKPTAVQALMKEPRQDFPAGAEPVMLIRGSNGGTYVAGLIRGEASGLETQDSGGKKVAKVVVGAQALSESGKSVASTENEILVEIGADGSFVGGYGFALKPGKYTLRAAALDPKSSKGSVVSLPYDVPDYGSEELQLGRLMLMADIQEGVGQADSKDPLSPFHIGNTRFVPRFANVFAKSDQLSMLAVIYNPKKDPATGKPSTVAGFSISRDGKMKAKAQDQTSDSENPTPSVGPIPLTNYEPGKYMAKFTVKDNVSGKDYSQEVPFEVK